jgi:hypothetical protein
MVERSVTAVPAQMFGLPSSRRNGRCWPWSHEWTLWVVMAGHTRAKETSPAHTRGSLIMCVFNTRRCTFCGLTQQRGLNFIPNEATVAQVVRGT